MKRMLLLLAFSAAAFAQDGFEPLFNGKNLDGWDGDPRMWSVRDGMIVGHYRRRHDDGQFVPHQQAALPQLHPARRNEAAQS